MVAVVAVGDGAFVLLNNNSGGDDIPSTDGSKYSYPNDDTKIAAGLTITDFLKEGNNTMKSVYEVTEVKDGTAYFDVTFDADTKDYTESEDGLTMFAPDGYYVPFNYISPEQKEGLTISTVGGTTTINGTSTETEYSITTKTTYDNIKIVRSGNDYALTGK